MDNLQRTGVAGSVVSGSKFTSSRAAAGDDELGRGASTKVSCIHMQRFDYIRSYGNSTGGRGVNQEPAGRKSKLPPRSHQHHDQEAQADLAAAPATVS